MPHSEKSVSVAVTTGTTTETHHPPPHCTHIHCLVSMNVQQVLMKVSGYHFFLHGQIQGHTFASSALPFQILFCQAAPFLPSVTQQERATILEGWFSLCFHITPILLLLGKKSPVLCKSYLVYRYDKGEILQKFPQDLLKMFKRHSI